MNHTNIDYLDYTWNPLAMRCTPVSEGCEHCWHIRMADRLAKNPAIPDDRRAAYAGEEAPILIGKELEAPLHLRKPSRIGVQFMGDLFHDDVAIDDLVDVFYVMAKAAAHTFLLLTKRPSRMLSIFHGDLSSEFVRVFRSRYQHHDPVRITGNNLWLGITIENQARADERIPVLLQIPAAKRWVSIEPMLGAVDLRPYLHRGSFADPSEIGKFYNPLDWVVLGGETGPGARPMHPDWVRSVRDQCVGARVPFFFKQWGEWLPWCELYPDRDPRFTGEVPARNGINPTTTTLIDGQRYYGVGNKTAGHLLDGREWREMPGVE